MDFEKLRKEALKLKDTAQKAGKDALEYGASKIAASKITLKTLEELKNFQKTSKNTLGTDSKTGKEKEFSHRSLVIFADTKSDFFTSMLYKLPLLEAKAFSQSVKLKLADINMKGLDRKDYDIEELPCLLVFENEKRLKSISGEENIQNLVKSLSLDINKSIDEL